MQDVHLFRDPNCTKGDAFRMSWMRISMNMQADKDKMIAHFVGPESEKHMRLVQVYFDLFQESDDPRHRETVAYLCFFCISTLYHCLQLHNRCASIPSDLLIGKNVETFIQMCELIPGRKTVNYNGADPMHAVRNAMGGFIPPTTALTWWEPNAEEIPEIMLIMALGAVSSVADFDTSLPLTHVQRKRLVVAFFNIAMMDIPRDTIPDVIAKFAAFIHVLIKLIGIEQRMDLSELEIPVKSKMHNCLTSHFLGLVNPLIRHVDEGKTDFLFMLRAFVHIETLRIRHNFRATWKSQVTQSLGELAQKKSDAILRNERVRDMYESCVSDYVPMQQGAVMFLQSYVPACIERRKISSALQKIVSIQIRHQSYDERLWRNAFKVLRPTDQIVLWAAMERADPKFVLHSNTVRAAIEMMNQTRREWAELSDLKASIDAFAMRETGARYMENLIERVNTNPEHVHRLVCKAYESAVEKTSPPYPADLGALIQNVGRACVDVEEKSLRPLAALSMAIKQKTHMEHALDTKTKDALAKEFGGATSVKWEATQWTDEPVRDLLAWVELDADAHRAPRITKHVRTRIALIVLRNIAGPSDNRTKASPGVYRHIARHGGIQKLRAVLAEFEKYKSAKRPDVRVLGDDAWIPELAGYELLEPIVSVME